MQQLGTQTAPRGGARASRAEYGSDLVVELLGHLGIPYVALNPGSSYRGIHDSLADRALNLLKRVGLDGEVTLIGGVALQAGMVAAVRAKLGAPVNVPAAPQYATALGAAMLGLSRHRKLAAAAA